ncbi:hypothetical protein CXG81DRAFT_25015 [Caulochytrium protostelioides]|uniref:UBX domain-containing protein n=1 Tax=Caulochytrium protostelioides TaxID=1555241 RepID=A0A4P9XB46_9FUNG|nr:hypothetical protein CXG81DRAFT_25015 [Caulochytrium protostelioides]|eukprot:RKP02321.1 hypothetical protein CXG81DRAFT_25015 [Caulochytrium protostelioides]
MDDAVSNFVEITGSTPEIAQKYLAVADGNAEQAILLFMDGGGQDLLTEAAARPRASDTAGRASGSRDPHDVPAPIAPRRSTLIGGDDDDDDDGPPLRLGASTRYVAHTAAPALRRAPFALDASAAHLGPSARGIGLTASPFAAAAMAGRSGSSSSSGSGGGGVGGGGGGASQASGGSGSRSGAPSHDRASRLAEIFRPPYEIIFAGDLERARQAGRDRERWILLTVHDHVEFACQTMVRDVWRDKTVQDVIRAHFLFVFWTSDSPDGQQYATFYHVKSYPYTAVLDPVTGECVKVWDKTMAADAMVSELLEFLAHPPPDAGLVLLSAASANATKRIADADASEASPTLSKRSAIDLDEDAQLQAALAASRKTHKAAHHGRAAAAGDSDALTISDDSDGSDAIDLDTSDDRSDRAADAEGDGRSGAVSDAARATAKPAAAAFPPLETDEPPAGPSVTRIQFRLPDGQRLNRRFAKAEPVRSLYRYVQHAAAGAVGSQPFDLTNFRENLRSQLDRSLEDAGLLNVSLSVDAQ